MTNPNGGPALGVHVPERFRQLLIHLHNSPDFERYRVATYQHRASGWTVAVGYSYGEIKVTLSPPRTAGMSGDSCKTCFDVEPVVFLVHQDSSDAVETLNYKLAQVTAND